MSNDPEVTRLGVFDMQVCVPEDYADEQVKMFADFENLCGTDRGWLIKKEGSKTLNGDPE